MTQRIDRIINNLSIRLGCHVSEKAKKELKIKVSKKLYRMAVHFLTCRR